jgi:hypothetical protein
MNYDRDDDREDAWVGWVFWKGVWTRCCEGATQVGAARRLEDRRRVLRLPVTKVRLLPANQGPPPGGVTRPRRRFELPFEFGSRNHAPGVNTWGSWGPQRG